IPPGTVCHELAVNFDLFTTIARIAGAEIPTDRIIDSKDLADLMRAKPGAKSPHEYFIYYNGNRMHGVRSGPWKLKIPTTLAEEFGDYAKLDNPEMIMPRALFDLESDPGEQKNVI